MKSEATTPEAYLAALPDDRRAAVEGVRRIILDNLPDGFVEGVEYGMLSYHIPLARYPDTYNGRPLGVAALANQKQYVSLYLMGVYADDSTAERFRAEWEATGKPLRMGKSCVRFTTLDDVATDAVAGAIARTTVDDFIAAYERSRRRA